MQNVTWTKAKWWSDDQHPKQDPRSTREDPRYQAKSKHEDGNQAGRKDREETNEEGARQRRPDAAMKASDASDRCPCNHSDRRYDWTLSEAVTRRIGDIVHHHGNVLSVTGRNSRTTGRTKKQSPIMSRKVLEQR